MKNLSSGKAAKGKTPARDWGTIFGLASPSDQLITLWMCSQQHDDKMTPGGNLQISKQQEIKLMAQWHRCNLEFHSVYKCV